MGEPLDGVDRSLAPALRQHREALEYKERSRLGHATDGT